jgi:ABC-type phosphate transport system substrate-binding protein
MRVGLFAVAMGFWCAATHGQVFGQELPERSAAGHELEGALEIALGSGTIQKLIEATTDGFMRLHPRVACDVHASGAAELSSAMRERGIGLAAVSRPLESQEVAEFERVFGRPPMEIKVARDAIEVLVHASNPIEGLTLQQLDAIFGATRRRGAPEQISRWGQLGLTGAWERQPIVLYGGAQGWGTTRMFQRLVLQDGPFRDSMKVEDVIDGVDLAVSRNPAAIGFAVNRARTVPVRAVGLAVKRAGPYVASTPENIRSGRYPLTRFMYLYVNAGRSRPIEPVAREYLLFVLSRQGQELAERAGYFSLDPELADRQRAMLQRLSTAAPGDGAAAQQSTPEQDATLDLLVVRKDTGQPLAGVPLNIRTAQQERRVLTDERGHCKVALPQQQPRSISITARADGFVPKLVHWGARRSPPTIPPSYTLVLEPAISIGGIVQDESGNPIEGVKIEFSYDAPQSALEQPVLWDQPAKTDANGRWRSDLMPANLDKLFIRLEHPDYLSDETVDERPLPPAEKLRDMTAVFVMKKGLSVSGVVRDEQGRPVAGALVAQGTTRHGRSPSTSTDADGRFRFGGASAEEMILTVQADGYGPALKQLSAQEITKPIEFRLGPGHLLCAMLVDQLGRPVAGADVYAGTWRGFHTLTWQAQTDVEGRVCWSNAPPDEVLISVSKNGYLQIDDVAVTASERECVVTLNRQLRITGQVRDAATGKALERFKLIYAVDFENGGEPAWNIADVHAFTGGRYEFAIDQSYPAHVIRIEADGYKPAVSRKIKDDEADVNLDFALERGSGPAGIVLGPDGTPLADAEVTLCTDSVYTRQTTTDAHGRFGFPHLQEPFSILVAHQRGFAHATREQLVASPTVTVQPWGRIEGTLKFGSRPAADQIVYLSSDTGSSHEYDLTTRTDGEGNFEFAKVPPGRVEFKRIVETRRGEITKWHYSDLGSAHVPPGQTVRVAFGGPARPVTGRLVSRAGFWRQIDWRYCEGTLHAYPPIPDNSAKMSDEEMRAWGQAWLHSEEGQAYARDPNRRYEILIEEDGSFRAEGVLPGSYRLFIHVFAPPEGNEETSGPLLGYLIHHFSLPAMSAGTTDETLDLGTLRLQLIAETSQ